MTKQVESARRGKVNGMSYIDGIEHIYSEYLAAWIPKYIDSQNIWDIKAGVNIYEWCEDDVAYINDVEDYIFFDTGLVGVNK